MKNIFLLVTILLVSISCNKKNKSISNLNGNKITTIGHGGMGISSSYPINSFESISKCLSLNSGGSELDVQLTKDSVLVAFHSQDLSEDTHLSGLINSLNWSEIKDARYKQTPYLAYSIISLEELFSNLGNRQSRMFVFDCKLYFDKNNLSRAYELFANNLVKLIQKYQLESTALIESKDVNFLNLLKSKMPNSKLFLYSTAFEEDLPIAKWNQFYGITISTKNITKSQIKTAHDNGLFVAIWNVYSKRDNKEAIEKNPDFIQTDQLKHLINRLD